MKNRVHLETLRDCVKFVQIVKDVNAPVYLTNNRGFRVSGKSLLGALASTEWADLWCECDIDIYNKIEEFIY